MELLKLEHVSLAYHTPAGETPALEDISFSLEQGEFAALVGPSGCGKSTLLNLIDGLLSPESGKILVQGKPAADSRLHMGYMLQKDHLFEWRTIYRNVVLGLEIQHRLTPENLARVDAMLETYGLAPFRNSRPSELSGGMRQRAALIRTLALDPSLLLLDEPFSALDYQTRLTLGDEIHGILRREGKTAVLVTHDIAEAISMSDRVLVFSSRPARLKATHSIVLSGSDSPIQCRNAPEFKDYFDAIWKELDRHDQ